MGFNVVFDNLSHITTASFTGGGSRVTPGGNHRPALTAVTDQLSHIHVLVQTHLVIFANDRAEIRTRTLEIKD